MYDAIVLAGGRARRLGGIAKPQLVVGRRSLLDAVVDAVAGAQRVVVVGPEQPVRRAVSWRREDPTGGGPVAAIAAGLPATSAEVVVVLAADLPDIAPAVPLLLGALPEHGAAMLETNGRANYLAAAWRRTDLLTALGRVGVHEGASVRALLADVPVTLVADEHGWGLDVDTGEDLERARTRGEATDA